MMPRAIESAPPAPPPIFAAGFDAFILSGLIRFRAIFCCSRYLSVLRALRSSIIADYAADFKSAAIRWRLLIERSPSAATARLHLRRRMPGRLGCEPPRRAISCAHQLYGQGRCRFAR